MRDLNITLAGNLVEDPELRFTQSGVAVCTLRVAVSRWQGKDKDRATDFYNVNAWRDLADNAAESFNKGDRVMVTGELKTRNYENAEGQTVWVTEIEADDIAGSVRWSKVKVEREPRKSSPPEHRKMEDADVPF